MQDIGDRMKANYEARAKYKLTRRTPVIIRVDGRAFHTFTRGFNRPFDNRIMGGIKSVMEALVREAQGCKVAYCQSDEISLFLTDWDTLQTESWFDYNIAKLTSVSASIATRAFNSYLQGYNVGEGLPSHAKSGAEFDARAFNIPIEEVANYFLWRAKDWYRNSITMYTQSFFSHGQLQGKSCQDMHEMLHHVGKNWTNDLTPAQRNGIFMYRAPGHGWMTLDDVLPNFTSIDNIVTMALPEKIT